MPVPVIHELSDWQEYLSSSFDGILHLHQDYLIKSCIAFCFIATHFAKLSFQFTGFHSIVFRKISISINGFSF